MWLGPARMPGAGGVRAEAPPLAPPPIQMQGFANVVPPPRELPAHCGPCSSPPPPQASLPRGQTGVGITSVLFHPSRPATAFAAVYGAGVFRSDDGGATWARLGKPKPKAACRMALDSKSAALFVTTRNKPGVLRLDAAADVAPAAAGWRDVTPRAGVALWRAPFCGVDVRAEADGSATVGVATCELDSAPGGRNSQVGPGVMAAMTDLCSEKGGLEQRKCKRAMPEAP
jgi:hypothetical protein